MTYNINTIMQIYKFNMEFMEKSVIVLGLRAFAAASR